MLSTEEILSQALELIPNARSWSKDLMCTDRLGRQVRPEEAVAFSPIGAIFAVCVKEYCEDIYSRKESNYNWQQKMFYKAVNAMEDVIGDNLNAWNKRDDVTFVHVRKAFETAIDIERGKEAVGLDRLNKAG